MEFMKILAGIVIVVVFLGTILNLVHRRTESDAMFVMKIKEFVIEPREDYEVKLKAKKIKEVINIYKMSIEDKSTETVIKIKKDGNVVKVIKIKKLTDKLEYRLIFDDKDNFEYEDQKRLYFAFLEKMHNRRF